DAKPGAFSRIGQAIRSRKRPLLLAAAALVLAISALQIFGESPADRPPQLAAVEKEAAPSPVAAPPSPAVAVSEEATVTFAPPEEISVRFGDGAVAPPADSFVPRAPASGPAAAAETSPDELAAGGDP